MICSLLSNNKYVLHSKNIKFYLERKIIVTKVHRGIKFTKGDNVKVVALLLLV